eukprot:14672204-Ditylum_brightwellii.AAC.1
MKHQNSHNTACINGTDQSMAKKAIDGPALPALNNIDMQQSAPTQAAITDMEWIMNFLHTYPNA